MNSATQPIHPVTSLVGKILSSSMHDCVFQSLSLQRKPLFGIMRSWKGKALQVLQILKQVMKVSVPSYANCSMKDLMDTSAIATNTATQLCEGNTYLSNN